MNEVLLRSLPPSVLAILLRRGADFAAAEDAVQDALVEAIRAWPAARRISRAKRTVAGVRFDQPGGVATVLRVLYLVFRSTSKSSRRY